MKKRILYLLFVLAIAMPTSSYGQLGGIVRRAVNRQINNEVDSALDKKVQEDQNKNRAKKAQEEQAKQAQEQNIKEEAVADQEEENDNSGGAADNSSGNGGGAAFSGLFGNKVTLKYKDDYSFTSRIHMVTEQYDNKDVMKMNFYMFYSTANPSIGIETQTITDEENQMEMNAKMVMDGENKTFIMLTDMNGMKMGTISEVPEENSTVIGPDGKPVKNYTPPTFTRTGNTRVIAGYKCDEYTYKDTKDKTSGKVWFTKDAKLGIDRKGWNNSSMSYYYGSNQFNDGIILANEAYDEKGKLEMKSETVEINENFPYKITVTGYTLRQMNINQKK
ncbi:MAG TPA: hypothetical protein VK207_06625 [Bacteroidales bacterium]|nr:hypothetical protein [Bacteroidales bacterium]